MINCFYNVEKAVSIERKAIVIIHILWFLFLRQSPFISLLKQVIDTKNQ